MDAVGKANRFPAREQLERGLCLWLSRLFLAPADPDPAARDTEAASGEEKIGWRSVLDDDKPTDADSNLLESGD